MTEKSVTFTTTELKAVLDAAIADALAVAGKAPPSVPVKNTLVDGRTEGQLKMDVLVCKTFKRAGFGEVRPRQDVRTYNRWMAEGWRVRPGEKATKVRQFRLFHKTQVEFVGIPPKEAAPSEAEITAVKEAKAAKPTIVERLKGKVSAQTSLPV